MALPTLRIIGFIIGIFLITLAIAMVVPMATLVIFERTSDLPSFLWASMITFIAGLALVIPGRPEHVHLRPRDMYLLTVSSWVVVCIFAALPFLLTQHISYTDSFFESMSGITATGSTVLSGLDAMSPGILIWRSLLHWLGGIGFIGMAVAILPLLRIGGMRLFQTESSDRSEKVMPRSHMVARLIVAAYVGITILGSLAFWWAGMGVFDAINHAMSAISTGGFSTSDESLAHWKQPAVHWVAVVVMILGSLPFTLYVATLRGNRRALIKDQQVQGLLGLLVVTWLVLGTWYWWTTNLHWLDALRHVALNVTSVVTTTGFALGDYSLWGNFSLMLFFYLGFIGGCSGSTAGGIKIFRFQVAYILLKANLNQLIHPRAVIKQKYNGHRLDDDIVRSILTFSFFFSITICLIALLLSLLGLDWMTALTGAASTVSGVGPGLGETIGPAGNFSLMLFFYLGFIGGCSGSTAGGIKIFRFQVAYILLKANLNQLIHPRAVIKQKYNGHRLDEEIVRSILTFSFFFAITICAIALALSLLGLDWMTALTGAASTVSGVGPGLGETIGPAGNFASLPDAAKWILSLGMLLGRLEIITVFVLCIPAFWRH